jgi:purine nucleosidase
MTNSGAKRIILDCDPAIGPGLDADDVLALLFVLASPELKLEGVTTTYGNVEAWRATENALRTLEAAQRLDVPVSMGMTMPLAGRLHDRAIQEFELHRSKVGPIDRERVRKGRSPQHASDFIVSKAMENPGEITVLAVGPLTNLAMAMLKEPELKSNLRQITILGGAFGREPQFGRGNITPVAEYNIWHDPLAADIVFTAGVPMTVVGLDLCNPNKNTVLYEDQLMSLVERKTPFTAFLREVCETYIKAPKFTWAKKGCVLYDILAAATLVDRSLIVTEKSNVRVETVGELAMGQTIASPSEQGNVDLGVDVDGPRFISLFVERIQKLVDRTDPEAAEA